MVGSEGNGLSRLVAETCDQLVSIPMANQLESLNAGCRRLGDALRDLPGAGLTSDPTRARPSPPDAVRCAGRGVRRRLGRARGRGRWRCS